MDACTSTSSANGAATNGCASSLLSQSSTSTFLTSPPSISAYPRSISASHWADCQRVVRSIATTMRNFGSKNLRLMPPRKKDWKKGTFQVGVFVRTPDGGTVEAIWDEAPEPIKQSALELIAETVRPNLKRERTRL